MTILAQEIVNALVLGCVYALFALGLTLIWGSLRILNMAHGAIFMWGGMFGVFIGGSYHLPLALLLPAAMVGSGLLAVAIDVLAFRPLRRRHLKIEALELGSLIASIGFSIILMSLAEQFTKGQVVHIPREVFPISTFEVAGLLVTNIAALMFVLGVLLTLLLAIAVRRTKQGKALRAIAFDPGVTSMLGVNVDRVTLLAMFVAGALAGAAGVLLTLSFGAAEYTMGDPLLLKAFAIIILGGVGSMAGSLVGGMIVAFVEVLALTYLNSQISEILTFGILVLILLVRPAGIFGRSQTRTV
jgi:branched-chain amino acid transport system permease protein